MPLAKKALGQHELIREVYSRFHRPKVVHIRPVKGEAFRLLRDLRSRTLRCDVSVSKNLWVGLDTTAEERGRIRPIGALYGLWIDTLKLVGDGCLGAEAKWKIDEESVQVTRDNWVSSSVLLQRVNGQLKTTPDDEWKAYMKNSRLEEMLTLAKSERAGPTTGDVQMSEN